MENPSEHSQCLDLSFNTPAINKINELTLVGGLISVKSINFKAILLVLTTAWNLRPNLQIKPLYCNKITCSFTCIEDLHRITETGPWAVKGAVLSLQQWNPNLILKELDFYLCPFWIQIHNLTPNCMNEDNIMKIRNFAGQFIRFDEASQNTIVRKFLHIKVLVNTKKGLKSRCHFRREDGSQLWFKFKCERLSDLCYWCGKIDHTETACSMPKRGPQTGQQEQPNYRP